MKDGFSRTSFRFVFEFMLAGFVGWIYEVVTVYVMWGYFSNRGILHMPIVPIYAVGAFILLAVLGEKKRNPVFVFLFSAVITTLFELGASYVLEFIFHKEFWTYETWAFSILDRSSLISSGIFGIFAVLYFFLAHPMTKKLSEKLPKPVCMIFSVICVTAVLVDLTASVTELLKNR